MKHVLVLLAAIVITFGTTLPCFAQDTLTNQSIINLKKSGFSADFIKKAISKNPCAFETNMDKQMLLKKEGVDESIITAMIDKTSEKQTAIQTSYGYSDGTHTTTVLEKLKDSKSGIYYLGTDNNLQTVNPAYFASADTKGGYWASFGMTSKKYNVSLDRPQANLRIPKGATKFYFHFNKNESAQDILNDQKNWYPEANNPNQFEIVEFEVHKNNREMLIGKAGLYKVSIGIDTKKIKTFRINDLGDGIYEIYFEKPLPKGEYGIFFSSITKVDDAKKIYDFSIVDK